MNAPKRNALGRGLDSLISMSEIRTDGSSAISEISVDDISPNPEQPRTSFDPETLRELSASIAELGIIQPLSLRKTDDGLYQIIAGERRWRAAKMAGLRSVPAYVRTASDCEITEMALIENIQREDLNAIEIALTFRKLIDQYELTQERLSERIGKKRATIANFLRLLKLPSEVQLGLRDKRVDMGHAKALLGIDDPRVQLKIYKEILREGLSVRKVEELAKAWQQSRDAGEEAVQPGRDKGNNPYASSHDFDLLKNHLSAAFHTPVSFSCDRQGKGKITFQFSNEEDLTRLITLFDTLR